MASVKVRDVMTPDPVCVAPDLSVKDAARMMVDRGFGSLPVVEGGRLIGIVTEGDLIMQDVKVVFPTYIELLGGFVLYPPATQRFEHELKKAVAADVGDVMTREPIRIGPDATIEDAATMMIDKDVSRLPVVEGDVIVGILSKSDIVRSLATED